MDQIVVEMKFLAQRAALDFALAVGELIIARLFDGDLDAWRLEGASSPSMRAVAEHVDLPISASALYRAVGVYELSERLPELARWRPRIGLTHLRAVLNLPDEAQRRLLRAAHDNAWPVDKLETETSITRENLRLIGRGRRGRPPLPAQVKAVRKLRRTIEKHGEQLEEVIDGGTLDEDTRSELRAAIAALQSTTLRLQRCLDPEPRRSTRRYEGLE